MPTLRDLRTAAGLSQTELANASGVSIETIKKIESGKVERPHPATLRLLAAVLGQVPVVMNGSRGGPVFDPGMFDNTVHNESPCLLILPDPGLGVRPGFVPLRETHLSGTIVGPLARLELTQHFSYQRSECDKIVEARYRFPLPGDAAVQNVQVRFGQVQIETHLAPREAAERAYADARQQGRQAALATRESADVFSLDLTGLQPDHDVVVQTSFVQAARPHGPGWELRVPLTVGPRYSRVDEAGKPAAQGQPLQVWRDPGHRFSLGLRFEQPDVDVISSSHALEAARTPGGGQRVRLAEHAVIPDRDLVLSWETPRAAHPDLDVIVHEDLEEGTRYFLALVTPPSLTDNWPTLDREVTLLIDRSSSMAGPKWQACRWAARRFLAGLSASDSFSMAMFANRPDWLFASPLPGTPANVDRAVQFIDTHGPDGGTELGVALEQALRSDLAPGERARHILLLTDAQVSDEGRILQLLESEAAREGGRRLSVISIDSAPRSAFVSSLAEAGGGEAVFLSSDPHQEDITSALDRVLDVWSRPIATDVELQVETSATRLQAHHAASSTRSSIRLGDLPTGRSLWVSGAVSLFSEPVFRLRSNWGLLSERALNLDVAPPPCPEIRALFGAGQIARLERLEAQVHSAEAREAILDELGYANDPVRLSKAAPIYAENAKVEGSILHRLLVRESLRFGLVCSATAFIGERREAGRRAEVQVHVPSALPAGWEVPFAARAPQADRIAGVRARLSPMVATPSDLPRFSYMRGDIPAPPAPKLDAPNTVAFGFLRFEGKLEAERGAVLLSEGLAGSDLLQHFHTLRATLERDELVAEGVEVWVCVDDPGSPVVRVKLRDLIAFGARPVNLAVDDGARVMLKLWVPEGEWPQPAAVLTVELS